MPKIGEQFVMISQMQSITYDMAILINGSSSLKGEEVAQIFQTAISVIGIIQNRCSHQQYPAS